MLKVFISLIAPMAQNPNAFHPCCLQKWWRRYYEDINIKSNKIGLLVDYLFCSVVELSLKNISIFIASFNVNFDYVRVLSLFQPKDCNTKNDYMQKSISLTVVILRKLRCCGDFATFKSI